MKPYYERDGIVIYHGDCREVLPTLDPVDLVLTDPPYGISHPTNYAERGRGGLTACRDYPPVHGDTEPFDASVVLALDVPTVLFGANHYSDQLPPASGWLVWDKERPHDLDQATAELAWTNYVKGVRVFRFLWNGCLRASREPLEHPTQKPESLIRVGARPEVDACRNSAGPVHGSWDDATRGQGRRPKSHRNRNRGTLLRDSRAPSRPRGAVLRTMATSPPPETIGCGGGGSIYRMTKDRQASGTHVLTPLSQEELPREGGGDHRRHPLHVRRLRGRALALGGGMSEDNHDRTLPAGAEMVWGSKRKTPERNAVDIQRNERAIETVIDVTSTELKALRTYTLRLHYRTMWLYRWAVMNAALTIATIALLWWRTRG